MPLHRGTGQTPEPLPFAYCPSSLFVVAIIMDTVISKTILSPYMPVFFVCDCSTSDPTKYCLTRTLPAQSAICLPLLLDIGYAKQSTKAGTRETKISEFWTCLLYLRFNVESG